VTPRTAAVVLAAGRGTRLGEPKALAVWNGEPFLAHVVRACREGGCESVWTVLRSGDAEGWALARRLGARPVENPEADRGMFSSVQSVVRAALADPSEPEQILVAPVDHPEVRGATVAALRTAPALLPFMAWVVPLHGNRAGHPIRLGANAARRLLDVSPALTLQEALLAVGADRVEIAVNDPGVRRNRNEPEPAP
jgi:nicotine blue oxidoreductase